jgi:mRNA interferase HigB
MRIISWRSLAEYGQQHPDVMLPLRTWYELARRSDWKSPQEINNHIPNARFVPLDRIVFNIKGNSHRLVVAVDYRLEAFYIKFIGSHADYDKIDVATVQMR